ncbi:MAG TPA: zinc-binding dehydrogenase [Steroidobacteraceae bacterium]|nr:zinc-binding dehydrogenase [Steroidobacteraceae bacterium]
MKSAPAVTRCRALRLPAPGRPLADETVDVEAPGPGEILVRVKAAGICHSDAHYRSGTGSTRHPLTLGHEVAGVVAATGTRVASPRVGERVCLHYLVTCGTCPDCRAGREQFCPAGQMIGKDRDGGFAEFIRVPARNAHVLPEDIPFEQGAIMMCSSATALHALRKARLAKGETVAVFGVGGLGVSAVQLARAEGAGRVFAVDVNPAKLALAARLGALPVDARAGDPVAALREATAGRGADVALELIGLARTMEQAVESLAPQGRAALAGLTRERISIAPYRDLLNREAEVIGVSDHLASEIPELIRYAQRGALDLAGAVTRVVPLAAVAVNGVLDDLEAFRDDVRSVVQP